MSIPQNFDLQAELAKCKTANDLTGKNGLIQRLIGGMLEQMLQKEMDEHLGYEKHSPEGHHSGNSRNGRTKKTLKSNYGEIEVEVPRDRNSEFEPIAVKKRQRSISDFDDKIISMYAKGMTTRDIQAHIQELFGFEMSPALISNITDKVIEVATDWQARQLQSVYPIVFFDAIHYKVKEGGKVVSKAAYTCLGIDNAGKKDVLGLWVGESEGSKFWLKVCTELSSRGVKGILIACIDGLKGLPDAIRSVFSDVKIQLCVIHMIRNSIRFIPTKHSKEFVADLKTIYGATTKELAELNLERLREKWDDRYPLAVKPWIANWENLSTFFEFSQPIRRIIYTTNAVECLHRQFRKVTKNKAVFPTDDALFKMLFLAVRDISKKWTMPHREWKTVISHLALAYGERLGLEIG